MNIILIAVDTLRADHLSAYGYARDTSPHLRALAAEGTRFSRFFAHNNTTHPSFTTLLSGRHPLNHGIVGHMGKRTLDPHVPLLTTVLREHGFATAAVDNLGRWFQRGFDTYLPFQFDQRATTTMYTGEEITALAAPLLDRLSAEGRPFFLFVHYWDPHTPYLPPPPYDTLFDPADATGAGAPVELAYRYTPLARYLKGWIGDARDVASVVARYDGEVAYADHCIGGLLAHLDRLGLREETLVAVTSDHGESLGEHAIYFDHHGLYDPSLHVPLLLRWPGHLPAGAVVEGLTGQMDLAPTLLDFAGLEGALDCEGRSLLGRIAGRSAEQTEGVLLACEATWQSKIALRTPGWKLIQALSGQPDEYGNPPLELYDLAADPYETRNLAQEQPEVVGTLLAEQERLVTREVALGGHPRNPMLDEGTTLRSVFAESSDDAALRAAVIALLREKGQLPQAQQEVYSEEEEALIEERLGNLGYL